MKYQAQLTPWIVYQVESDSLRNPINRFRRRNDADAYIKVLRNTKPQCDFTVAFDSESFARPVKEVEPALI
jgi:hypothetical protein